MHNGNIDWLKKIRYKNIYLKSIFEKKNNSYLDLSHVFCLRILHHCSKVQKLTQVCKYGSFWMSLPSTFQNELILQKSITHSPAESKELKAND